MASCQVSETELQRAEYTWDDGKNAEGVAFSRGHKLGFTGADARKPEASGFVVMTRCGNKACKYGMRQYQTSDEMHVKKKVISCRCTSEKKLGDASIARTGMLMLAPQCLYLWGFGYVSKLASIVPCNEQWQTWL